MEYAIILPALLMMLLGAVDVGRLMWLQVSLDRAVEVAARCAAINTGSTATICNTAANIQTYAASQAFGMTVDSSAFTSTTASCGSQVSATLPFVFATPWITSTINVSASACYPPA